MKTPALSTIYLDNQRIGLMGDPSPRVAKIVAAGGRSAEGMVVVRTRTPTSAIGTPVALDDVIDRTAEPAKAIYLTCRPKADPVARSPASSLVVDMPDAAASAPKLRGPLPTPPAAPEPAPGGGVEPEWRV